MCVWRADRRVVSVEERRGGERVSRVSVHVRRVVSVVESQVGVGLVRDCIDCGGVVWGVGGWGGVCNRIYIYWMEVCNRIGWRGVFCSSSSGGGGEEDVS